MSVKSKGVLLQVFLLLFSAESFAQEKLHPNVVLIITDDQGYGDLGITGNPYVKTPVIDKLATESIRFNNFYVSPVCAPTRSSLLTGRYSLRTGVRDTYNGGAIMAATEVTIAELLKQANYKTGIFGKWHLGDNYPSRPGDQGFDETLIHLAGGMGQVGDITTYFQKDSSYFNPVLWHNNKMKSFKGYCSDIFADQAINFITRNAGAPFFCYLSFNAPHTPLQVPEEYYRRYKNIDPAAGFKYVDHSGLTMTEKDKEDARRVYAMVNNIDDNIGKLLKKLEALGIADNTIVIFMSDNGPQQSRYLAGLRGLKGKVYEGGVRVPFYMRYPLLGKNKDINNLAAHIDVLPTLANLCHVRLPDNRIIDGKNLVPAVTAEAAEWNNRSLFFYWTRRYPEPYQNMSLRKGNYKLVGNTDADADIKGFELYDLSRDPGERHNILPGNRAVANDLKAELDKIFKDLAGSENFIRQPAIVVGSDSENPILLNRNDAGGQRAIWAQEEIYGKWRVHVHQGYYNIKFKFIRPVAGKGNMYLEANESLVKQVTQKEENTDLIEMKNVYFPEMECDLIPYYTTGSKNIFPFWVEMEKIN